MNHFEMATSLAVALVSLSACGETDGSGGSSETTGAGASTTAGTAGSGGAAGSGGTAGDGGTASDGGTAGASAGTTAGGESSGGTGGGCSPTDSGSGIAIPANCEPLNQCLQDACGESYTQCLGENYANGDYSGGACEAAFQCVEACGCEPACSEQCYQNDPACVGCVVGLFLCGYECEDELEACEG
jgi:hypothetical protein